MSRSGFEVRWAEVAQRIFDGIVENKATACPGGTWPAGRPSGGDVPPSPWPAQGVVDGLGASLHLRSRTVSPGALSFSPKPSGVFPIPRRLGPLGSDVRPNRRTHSPTGGAIFLTGIRLPPFRSTFPRIARTTVPIGGSFALPARTIQISRRTAVRDSPPRQTRIAVTREGMPPSGARAGQAPIPG
jgi:hypothetical protein